MSSIVDLQGCIQNYLWGGHSFLAQLLEQPAPAQQPQAEYWLGAHPAGETLLGNNQTLADHIARQSLDLRFLLKVLDVRDMLSIQVHPNKKQAELGFELENQAGVPLQAKHRNYKDSNHKPELMVALSEFWLLHGFRPKQEILNHLLKYKFLTPIAELVAASDIKAAFAAVLDDNNTVIEKANQALKKHFLFAKKIEDKSSPDFWIQRWLSNNPNTLKGVLAIYFLNLCKIDAGDSVFQPAGLLHAYLEGQNIELMANSDNVLRAGLTPKHIDTGELLKIGLFEPTEPRKFICAKIKQETGWLEYITPFDEFRLTQANAQWKPQYKWRSEECEILLCVSGKGRLQADSKAPIEFKKGSAFFIAPGTQLDMTFEHQGGQVFRAKNKILQPQQHA